MPKRGPGRVVPIVVGSVGVLALVAAGWVAMDRGLLTGLGDSGATDSRLVDITRTPSEAWTYSYLPRSGEVSSHDQRVDGDAAFFLTADSGSSRDQVWSLQRVDLEDGTQDWSIDLDDAGGMDEVSGGTSILGLLDGRIYVAVSSYDPETNDSSSVHQVLDSGTGEVLDTYDEDLQGWTVLGQGLYQTDEDVLSRLDPEDPTGPPLWTVVTDGPGAYHGSADGYVSIAADTTVWVDAETGEEPDWFTDDAPDLSYQVVGGQVYRTESGSRGSFLERLADDGAVLWSADADSFRVTESAGTPVVLAMESGGGEGSTYDYLQRLDPRDGEEMWDEGLEADFDWVSWVVGDVMVLVNSASERSELYSLDDAERISRLRASITGTGSRVLYAMDEGRLSAIDLEGDQLWSVRARGATDLLHAPGYLITRDSSAGRLTRWE